MSADDELEAGWKELQQGRADVARKHAEAALAEAQSADALTLLAAALAHEGEIEQAIKTAERGAKLDKEAFEPVFLLAELQAGVGDIEPALDAVGKAVDRAEEEDEFISAILLKAELELAIGDDDAATQTLGELPPSNVPLHDLESELRAAAMMFEIGEIDESKARLERARAAEPENADTVHLLGMIAESEGDEDKQRECFLRTRELDLKAPASDYSVEKMEKAAERALEELPEKARKLLANVPIMIDDYPSEELVRDGLDPRLLGVFDGVPFPEQSNAAAPPHLEHIVLFKRNIERDAEGDEAIIEDEIRTTLLHETAHFFGLDEDDLEALGLD